MSVDQNGIAALLQQAAAAHREAYDARRRKRAGDARAALQRAFDLRTEAHAADPEHADPAWAAEAKTAGGGDPHEELMQFYRVQLGLESLDAPPSPA